MIQLISLIIFIVSSGVLLFLLYKKIPVLVNLPKNGHHGFKKPKTLKKLEKRIKDIHFDFFEKQIFLHKILSKAKIWILKTETKIDGLLHGIRKNAQQLDSKKKRKK